MLTLPKIVRRKAQPYIYIRSTLIFRNIKRQAPVFQAELRKYLEQRNVTAYGPAMIRSKRILGNGDLDMEFAYFTKTPLTGAGPIRAGIVPAGSYASLSMTGNLDRVTDAYAMLNGWLQNNGYSWALDETGEPNTFESSIAIFFAPPTVEPEPAAWRTEIAMMVANDDGKPED